MQSAVHIDLFHDHAVDRQCAGLVGTDIGHRSEGFHGRQFSNQCLLLDQLLGAERQRDGYDGGQGLRNGRHRQRDCGQQHQQRRLPSQESRDKNDNTNGQHGVGELLPEGGEPFLKRCPPFILVLEQTGDPSKFGFHPGVGHQAPPPAVAHQGAFVGHVFAVPDGQVRLFDRCAILFDGYGFAGQGRFLDSELDRFGQSKIGRNHVAGLQNHEIARNQPLRGNRFSLTVPDDDG